MSARLGSGESVADRVCRDPRSFSGVLLTLVLLGLGACSEMRQVAPRPRPELALLVSIDTLRADHVGSYGHDRPTTPRIDGLAAGGVVFEDASSVAPWTLPAHASMFTGLYPFRHGLKSTDWRLAPGIETLASQLAGAGWQTAAVVNSGYLSDRFGLDRGFEELVWVPEAAWSVGPSDGVTNQAIEWLRAWIEGPRERPLFLFVHSYDVHSDYNALPRYLAKFVPDRDGVVADGTTRQLKRFRGGGVDFTALDAKWLADRYDASLRQTDDELGRIFDFLAGRGWLDRALVAITSDHGEELLEHGGVLHGATQYEEVLRVPLILRYPPALPATRVEAPVSLVDLTPTLLEILGAPGLAESDGADLSPLWKGPESPAALALRDRVLLSEADHTALSFDSKRAARRGRHKLHHDRVEDSHRLFDLAEDPGEHRDVAADHPELTAELLAEARRIDRARPRAAPEPERVELTEEERERLRALGYLD